MCADLFAITNDIFLISATHKTFDKIPIARSMLRGTDISNNNTVIRETLIMRHTWAYGARYRQFSFNERVSLKKRDWSVTPCLTFSSTESVNLIDTPVRVVKNRFNLSRQAANMYMCLSDIRM